MLFIELFLPVVLSVVLFRRGLFVIGDFMVTGVVLLKRGFVFDFFDVGVGVQLSPGTVLNIEDVEV